jgi:predicted nucleic acid-binding Zn ribbon protein
MSLERSEPPSCHDDVTMACPVCQGRFIPNRRRLFCSDACRAAAYRRRRDQGRTSIVVPVALPRRPITVYECDSCGERALGNQRCDPCGTFMRRIGIGGCCPSCDEPIAVAELVDQEVMQ